MKECEEKIRSGKDTVTRFTVRDRKFSERENSLLTGTITPSGKRKVPTHSLGFFFNVQIL